MSIKEENVRYICILDFEATCWKENGNHEIIEFPSILWKWTNNDFKKISSIQNYVKPLKYPVVSQFCEQLTGISQEIVNNGMPLQNALNLHKKWLNDNGDVDNTLIVTCGKWDIDIILPKDLKLNGMKKSPHCVYKKFINIKNL